MEARQYRERLDIEAVGFCKLEYYEYLRRRYTGIIYPETLVPPTEPILSSESTETDPTEVRHQLRQAFRRMKKVNGYGG